MPIVDELRTYISETFFVEDVPDDESFMRSGIIDSTGMLELVTFIEKTFEITAEPSELVPENLDTLRNVVAFIERKRAHRTP